MAVAIYTHPELFPPVLNAVDELAGVFKTVHIISRNLVARNWSYPDNVQLLSSGNYVSIRDSEKAPMKWKLNSFFRFTRDFQRILKKEKPDWVMCNDPISLYAFSLIRPLLGYSPRLWYHNHDVVDLESQRKFSVGWFAVRSERKQFNKIDLFTLPSKDRLKYFPIENLKGKSLVIPNYPSLRRMKKPTRTDKSLSGELKLIYQGHIGEGHGLKEIIEFVKTDPGLRLTIIGPGNEPFVQSLKTQVSTAGIEDRVSIRDPVPYAELSAITRQHQVGLAIHQPVNTAFRTAALASNKIYEYAASGLTVLYYGDEHYRHWLGNYRWCFPTRLTMDDLSASIRNIRANYPLLSEMAEADFQNKLNFGAVFHQVLPLLAASQSSNQGIKRTPFSNNR